MTATNYSLQFSQSEVDDDEVYTHHQLLEVGDVIKPRYRDKWFRVVNILSHRRPGKGRVAVLSQGADTEALAHDPKATPP